MHSEQLEQQLAAYAGFLDEVSRERVLDFGTDSPNPERVVGNGRAPHAVRTRNRNAVIPWFVAVAAAVGMILAVLFLLPDGQDRGLETIDRSELEERQVEVVESTPVRLTGETVAELLSESSTVGSVSLFQELLAPDMALNMEGIEFGSGPDYEVLTDEAIAELVDVSFAGCEERAIAQSESTALSCDWRIEFTMLGGTVPDQHGVADIIVRDGEVTEIDLSTRNLEEVASGLGLYRGWVEASAEPADELFSEDGTLLLGPDVADRHRNAARAFLQATDVERDPANFGYVVMATLRSRNDDTIRDRFGDEARWISPTWENSGERLLEILNTDGLVDLANYGFRECEDAGAVLVSCDLELTYPLVPGLGVTHGRVEVIHDDEKVESVRIRFLDSEQDRYLDRLSAYRSWLAEQEEDLPGIVETMFHSQDLLSPFPDSIALHRTLGPEWSATLEG